MPPALLRRLARAYGTRIHAMLETGDLGPDLGGGLHTAEVDYLVKVEWARTVEDILYRRSKLGLHVPPETPERLAAYLAERGVA
jgi:glycerol-3-phosphate dehydrogenase